MKLFKNAVLMWWECPGMPPMYKCLISAWVMREYQQYARIWGSIIPGDLGESGNENIHHPQGRT